MRTNDDDGLQARQDAIDVDSYVLRLGEFVEDVAETTVIAAAGGATATSLDTLQYSQK